MRRYRLLLTVCLGLLAAASPYVTAAQDLLERQRWEATNLFARILERTASKPSRCDLAATWLDYPVPEGVARRHLGLTIRADLVPSHHATRPVEVIDPSGRMQHAFCDDKESKMRQDELVQDFTRGVPGTATARLDSAYRLTVSRTEYSFPIFSRNYRRAIIVVARTSYFWVKPPAGEVKATGLEAAGEAEIYGKQDGAWQLLARESLFSAH